jgi:hypothetical protein
MSPARLAVLSLGLLAGALVGAYPPWVETRAQVPGPDAAQLHPVATSTAWGYAPVFSPPAARYQPPADFGYMVERATYRIDLPRLLAQWAALGCLTAGLYVLAGRRTAGPCTSSTRPTPRSPGNNPSRPRS